MTDEAWKAFQIEIAQEWRDRHNLPKVTDETAVKLHWTIPTDKPAIEAKAK